MRSDSASVSISDARNHIIPIAPHEEQDRIVAKIEELFSELDKGVESLKTAREQLKIHRQALLNQAFEGKLTARMAQKNKNETETASQLIARIKNGTRSRYRNSLAIGRPLSRNGKQWKG